MSKKRGNCSIYGKGCTDVASAHAVFCPWCGGLYLKCRAHGGDDAAKRSLRSHKGLCMLSPTAEVTP